MNIQTDYWPKPIPLRQFDWSAIDADSYDLDQPVGYGRTEEEAIADLVTELGLKPCLYCSGAGHIKSNWQDDECPQCHGEKFVPEDDGPWPE